MMIIVSTSCRYFEIGFEVLVEKINKSPHSFSKIVFCKNISSLSEKILGQAKAVIVDYSEPKFKNLVSLLEYKSKFPSGFVILIARETSFEHVIYNILINSVSNFTISCVDVVRKLTAFLENFSPGTQSIVITKNMHWYHIEKEKKLTKKEILLLPYIISGKNNKEISRYVTIGSKTISHHRRSIYHKFQVNNLTGLFNVFERYI
ncbi:TPA: LuxR C-terminal-related transcriptional regulator [Citrobacter freundii]